MILWRSVNWKEDRRVIQGSVGFFAIFYAMTTVGFITLTVYRLVTGEALK
jgi:hypothetical protein